MIKWSNWVMPSTHNFDFLLKVTFSTLHHIFIVSSEILNGGRVRYLRNFNCLLRLAANLHPHNDGDPFLENVIVILLEMMGYYFDFVPAKIALKNDNILHHHYLGGDLVAATLRSSSNPSPQLSESSSCQMETNWSFPTEIKYDANKWPNSC